MADYIETTTKSGAKLLIEVAAEVRGSTGFGRQTSTENSDQVSDAYTQMLAAIEACASGVIETIEGLPTQPSAASIDFGVKIDGKAGAMIAKSLGEGQVKVSLSWKQPEPEKKEDGSES